jgi:glycosyltransferase involved in cell wall biosynthesis
LEGKNLKILLIHIGDNIFNPKRGAENRVYNLMRVLSKKNSIITLESARFKDHPDKEGIVSKRYYLELPFQFKINTHFWEVLMKIVSANSLLDFNPLFWKKIFRVIKKEKPEIIHKSAIGGVLALKLLTKLNKVDTKIVYDAHNFEVELVEQFKKSDEDMEINQMVYTWIVPIIEKFSVFFAHYITVVSERDKMNLMKKYKIEKDKITVIPNGTIICKTNKVEKDAIKSKMGINENKIIILFHGTYSHFPNREAINHIINYIAPKLEEINARALFVVGGTDVPKFKRINIKSLGFIEDLYKVMSIADIALVPLTRGAGTKLKVFDYMGMGLPIVTTKKGIEGIEAENGEHAIIVDDVKEEFIEAINYLVENEDERERLGRNARKLAEEKYDWEKIGEKLNGLYNNLVRKQR